MRAKRRAAAWSLCLFVLVVFQFDSSRLASAESSIDDREQAIQQARALKKLWNRESLEASLLIFQRVADGYEGDGNPARVAYCLREAGRVQRTLGDKDAAVTTFTRSLDSARKAAAINEEVKVLSDLASLTFELGHLSVSKNYLLDAEKLAAKTSDPAAQAAFYWVAGDYYYFQDDLSLAETVLLKAIELFKSADDTAGECDAHISLGYVYSQRNRYGDALEHFTAALEVAEPANDPRASAASLKALGTGHYLKGDPQTAFGYYRRCLDLFPEDIDRSERAVVYNGTGSIYEYFGDYESSILERRKALALFSADKFVFGEMATLYSIGTSSLSLEKTDDAKTLFIEVERLAKTQSSNLYLTWAYIGLGDVLMKLNDSEQARQHYLDAKKSIIPNTNRRQLASVYEKIGDTYAAESKLIEAKEQYKQSLELNRVVRDEFSEADVHYKLAKIESVNKNIDGAIESVSRSIEITESMTNSLVESNLRTQYLSSAVDRYELYINLLMRLDSQRPAENYDRRALIASERSRGRTLLENVQLSGANFAKDAPPELLKAEKDLAGKLNLIRTKLSDLLSTGSPADEVNKAESEAREIQNQLEYTRSQLKQTSPTYAAIKEPQPFDVDSFQRDVLDDNSALLEFSLGTNESYLWVIQRNAVDHYILPPREQIEAKVSKLLESLRSRERRADEMMESFDSRISAADSEYPALAKSLSDDLLGPAAEKIVGKRLIISPDGRLGYLPFAALPAPNSVSGESLIRTNEIVYTPSASMLSFLKTTAKNERPPPTKDLMVFADPVFASGDERLTGNEPHTGTMQASLAMLRSGDSFKDLGRLPASQTEARSVTEILTNSTIASGFSANRERVLNTDLADYRVLHFATHGIFNEQHPELSGILLSLFDEKGNASEGFIREQDIYGLDLNADLVVLSACNSGVGKEVRGEGIMSLNSAFLQSGARSVVSSLWKVDDYATETLMRSFYREMASGGKTPAQALRSAQLELSSDARYRSPFYWAAFTIQGDGGSKLSFSTASRVYLSASFGIIVIGILLTFYLVRHLRRRRIIRS